MLGKLEIENRFGSHKATVEGPAATNPIHKALRLEFRAFVEHLDRTIDDGREKSLAMTALEEASMWSHKAIAKNAPLTDENQPQFDFRTGQPNG